MTSATTSLWMISTSCMLLLFSCFYCSVAGVTAHHGASHPWPPPSALVVGSVHLDYSKSNPASLISDAQVSVQCADAAGRAAFRQRAVTDGRGVFRVRLTPEASSRLSSVTSCSLQLLRSNAAPCGGAPVYSTSTGFRLAATKRGGAPVFSTGVFAVLKELSCGEKSLLIPPVPLVPEPPNVGGVPIPPNPITPAPPPLLPPLVPSPAPPALLPPLVPQPPPASLIPPLLPLLSPPPPPPPPPVLPFLPPLPPLVPGVPPVSSGKNGQGSP